MQAAKQTRFSRNVRRCSRVSRRGSAAAVVQPAHAELRLAPDGRDVLDRGERLEALLRVRHVRVEQRQVELHVQRLLVELARQVHARLGRVHVLVEAQHHVVGDDRVARREERDQAPDEVPLALRHSLLQVGHVGREVDLLDRPGVLDGGPVHLEELGVHHRPQRQAVAGVEDPRGTADVAHSHASQCSGFSSEQAIASASVALGAAGAGTCAEVVATVALAMRVAGRERR